MRGALSRDPAAPSAAAPGVPAAARTAPGLRVETISDVRDLLRIGTDWDRAVEAAGIGHPFLSHAFIRVWWECFGRGRSLHVVVVRSADGIAAIAPLMREVTRLAGVRVRQIGSIHNDHTPRSGLIVADREAEACRAIWDHLGELRGDWDVLSLRQVPAGCRPSRTLPRLAAERGRPTGVWRSDSAPYVILGRSFDAYLAGLSHNHRAQMRKRLRRLARLGAPELETVAAPAEAERALADGLRLEAAGWKRRAGTAILCRPELVRFYTLLARAFAADGRLRLLFLRLGSRRIAFAFGLLCRDRLFVLKAGFDPEFAAWSPYQALCWLVLREACAQGLAEYDFLGGSDTWKLHWTGTVREHDWLYVFGDSARARFLHAAKFVVAPRLRGRLPGTVFPEGAAPGGACTSPPGRG